MRSMRSGPALVLPLAMGLAACQQPAVPQAVAAPQGDSVLEEGHASYYSHRFSGRRMASGERLNQTQYVAAHRTLPFGTLVRVTNLHNGRSVVVRIADRGPHTRGRILDVSQRVADSLDMRRMGVARVAVSQVGYEEVAEASDEPRGGSGATTTQTAAPATTTRTASRSVVRRR
jgi:rare lipoprotein A